MKPFINYGFAPVFKKIAFLGLMSALIVSCGSDNKNKDNGSGSVTNPAFGPGAQGQQAQSTFNNLKSQYACQQGRVKDLNFTVSNGQVGYNTIAGQLTGGSSGGSVVSQFAGINYGTRDILYVLKKSNGGQVTYDVILSLCAYRDQYREYIDVNASLLSNFYISQPLSLSDNASCATGSVLNGWVTFTSSAYGPIPTQFAAVSCQ